jgi:hypothetical protein
MKKQISVGVGIGTSVYRAPNSDNVNLEDLLKEADAAKPRCVNEQPGRT